MNSIEYNPPRFEMASCRCDDITSCTIETRKLIVLLGVIAFIGSCVAAGCCYYSLGPASLAFLAGGVTILILSVILGRCFNSHTWVEEDMQAEEDPNCVRQAAFIERTAVGTIRDMQRFGKVEWERYFGVVPDEPRLDNIDEILNAPCPFSGDDRVKVKDTHMLVLIPATVGGEALNLNRLKELIQDPNNNGYVTNYQYYSNDVCEAHGATESGRSYWVLMTRDVIPESRNKSYNEQKELVTQQGHGNYTLPGALEAAVCILMEHVVSENKLFGTNPLTYTRCSEIVQDYPVVVGNFGSDGLFVHNNDYDYDYFGVGALRMF